MLYILPLLMPAPEPSPLSAEALLIIAMLGIATLLALAMCFFFWRVLSKKNATARKAQPQRPQHSGVQSLYTRAAPADDASQESSNDEPSGTIPDIKTTRP